MDGAADAADSPAPDAAPEAKRTFAVVSAKTPASVSASVDALKGELAISRRQAQDALRDFKTADTERKQLVEKVVVLEASQRRLLQEVEQWRQRCIGFEQECASLAVLEDACQAKLREAHKRERELAVNCIEGRILCTEAENVQAKAQTEARSQSWQAQQMEHRLMAKNQEAETLHEQKREADARGETFRAEAETSQFQLKEALKERAGHQQGLVEAESKFGALQARISTLEAALQAAAIRQVDSNKDVAKFQKAAHDMDDLNRRLRLDLQDAISQAVRAGEVPFYSGGGGRFIAPKPAIQDTTEGKEPPALVPWNTLDNKLPRPLDEAAATNDLARSPIPVRSRLDYPKSSHARKMRQNVLNAREDALDCMAALARESPLREEGNT